jgi:hypothetical protein
LNDVSRAILEKWQLIWQSPGRSILIKILIGTLMLFALVPPIILILVFFIPILPLFIRWFKILGADDSEFNAGDTKVPTFYSSRRMKAEDDVAYAIMMSVVGIVSLYVNQDVD